MTGTGEWNTGEEKRQQDFLWALGLEAKHQITKSEYQTDPDNIKIDKLIKLYTRYYLQKRKKYNSTGDFFCAKQTDTETSENHCEKFFELEKNAIFRNSAPIYLYQIS